MSNKTYREILYTAIHNLKSQLEIEQESKKEETNTNEIRLRLYLNYILIFQQLEECYDAIIQSQIRMELHKTMEFVICKIIELRYDTQLHQYASCYNTTSLGDNNNNQLLLTIMKEMKLSANAFHLSVPRYFKEDHEKQQMIRDSIIQEYMKLKIGDDLLHTHDNDDASIENQPLPKHTNIIHSNNIIPLEGRIHINENTPTLSQKEAVSIIQKSGKRFISKIRQDKCMEEERIFLGMQTEKNRNNQDQIKLKLNHAYSKRKQEQKRNNEEFQQVLMNLKHEILEEEGFEMNETLREERFRWIAEEITRKKSVPDSIQGFYAKDDNATPAEHLEEGLGQSSGDTVVKGENNKINNDAKNHKVIGKEQIYEHFEQDKAYELFSTRKSLFHSQSYDRELAKLMIVRDQVHELITKQVDNSLEDHLKKVKEMHTAASKKSKKKAGKKSKKKAGGKSKKEKPLPGAKIPDLHKMDTDHMLSILIEHKIVTDVRKNASLDQFEAADTCLHPDLVDKQSPASKYPSLSQLRSMITEMCILPQGSNSIKKQLDPKYNSRSIMFYGPQGCGKSLMAEAVAAELGALFINLSPSLIEGKYTDKIGPTTLMHMIFTVAKEPAYAPVVIHIDSCEEFFQCTKKKKGATVVDKNGPVRFQKDLLIYKNQALTASDRVIVIGTTKYPEKADWKLLWWKGATGKVEKQGFFETFLHFPFPNYFDRVKVWKICLHKCLEEKSMDSNKKYQLQQLLKVDYGALAKFSEGYTTGDIVRCIEDTSQILHPNHQIHTPGPLFTEKHVLSSLLQENPRHEEDTHRFGHFAKKVFLMQESKMNAARSNNITSQDKEKPTRVK